ncbi:zinc finger protein, putative [Entamoeba histolytica HM-1:IMSS]|uniref:Palmitoyltransferase n=6 Tax=Entamoeba histolytica TaxID=5759 RepID=C4M026_ENTH1|nr:zinc finger protein, putative [Entamoeba histolytica HM-1:IMSS]EAL46741.2 zinc finger protein, putative [Entamoeba histolytica HM-1:IMSS]EMD47959.1 zinc finger protein, putative [Entamoeba histolytica KU27]ENY62710.1 zinc finger protein, putative [Entamoeba histolytica HM-1:IMSS-A]|eukprot:XP_652127.2 zinc finger protein, putative [Entamoeba histolytica HM-1:IMSS]
MYIRTVFTKHLDTVPTSKLCEYFDGDLVNSPYISCETCQCLKPFRCHHCQICDCCIYRMDHHCIWVGQCIGIHNIRFFFLFISSLSLSLLLGAITTYPLPFSTSIKLLFTFECVLGSALFIFAFGHFLMIVTNQTSLEISSNIIDYIHQPSHLRRFITPYDLGISTNIHQILRFASYWELFNPFSKQVSCDPMKVIVSREYMMYCDCLSEENEQNQ